LFSSQAWNHDHIAVVCEEVKSALRWQRRHDNGLAGGGGHLEGDAGEQGIGVLVRLPELVVDPGIAVLGGGIGT
jgi:hypothetical protein